MVGRLSVRKKFCPQFWCRKWPRWAIIAFGGPEGYFSLAIIAFGAFELFVQESSGPYLRRVTVFKESENPRVRNIFCPRFRGRKRLRQFYVRLENAFFLQEKPMPIKFLVWGGGGVFWVFFGGGSADFIFMGARIFSEEKNSLRLYPVILGHLAPSKSPGRNCA